MRLYYLLNNLNHNFIFKYTECAVNLLTFKNLLKSSETLRFKVMRLKGYLFLNNKISCVSKNCL